MKFSIKDFFNKSKQIHSFMRIWSHLLKKSLMENFIFRALILKANYLAICPYWLLLLPAKLSIGQFNPIMSIFPCFLTFLLQHRSQFSTFIQYSLNIFKNFLNSLEISVFSKSSTDLHQVFRNDKGTN